MAAATQDAAVMALDYLEASGVDPMVTGWVWSLVMSGDPGLEALGQRALMLPHDPAAAAEAWKALPAGDRAALGELVAVWGEKLVRQAAAWRTRNPELAKELDEQCRKAAQERWEGADGSWACAWGRDGWERTPLVEFPALDASGRSAGVLTVAAAVGAGFLVARIMRG